MSLHKFRALRKEMGNKERLSAKIRMDEENKIDRENPTLQNVVTV